MRRFEDVTDSVINLNLLRMPSSPGLLGRLQYRSVDWRAKVFT